MSRKSVGLYQLTDAPDNGRRFLNSERALTEMYQSFMSGYVRRINEATLNVTIGGVKIGQAKYTRLAQINLKTRIITFSRYAIENVPERGRRYLVLHELSHVKEPSHNRRFWEFVERYEPNYKQIGRELELAFRRNVREDQLARQSLKRANPLSGRLEEPKLLLNFEPDYNDETQPDDAPDMDADSFECRDDEFGLYESGIMYGGSEIFQVAD